MDKRLGITVGHPKNERILSENGGGKSSMSQESCATNLKQ
jgi:hypothetical protein